ncbi:MAG: hypothetical protein LUD29_03080 [Clostridia bacterium]|nr:hypothetical protein [Clostridia bacterium]
MGCFYVILRAEPGLVFVADGKTKGVENPKKKNLRHVRLLPEEIAIPDEDAKTCDNEIHRALKALEEKRKTEDGECQKTT